MRLPDKAFCYLVNGESVLLNRIGGKVFEGFGGQVVGDREEFVCRKLRERTGLEARAMKAGARIEVGVSVPFTVMDDREVSTRFEETTYEMWGFVVREWDGHFRVSDEGGPRYFLNDGLPLRQMFGAHKFWLPQAVTTGTVFEGRIEMSDTRTVTGYHRANPEDQILVQYNAAKAARMR